MDSNLSYLNCEFNTFNSALNKTAFQYVDDWAEVNPDHEAYVFRSSETEREAISYAELKRGTDNYAVWLRREFGLKKGDRIGLLCENGLVASLCDLASGRIGVVTVRLYTNQDSADQIEKSLNSNQCTLLLTQQSYLPLLATIKSSNGLRILLTEAADSELPYLPDFKDVQCTDQELNDLREIESGISLEGDCTVYSTSGSTGEPKFVVHSHLSWINYIPQVLLKAGFRNSDRFLNERPGAHIAGNVASTLPFGATMICVNPLETFAKPNSQFLLSVCREERVTCGMFFPYLLYDIVRSGADFSGLNLKFLLCAGQILTRRVLEDVGRCVRAPIVNLFGTTEVGEISATSLTDSLDSVGSTIGEALPGSEVKVVHPETREIIPRGEIGLLAVKKAFVWRYHGRAVDENAFDRDGYFYSGDLALVRDDDRIQVMGRRDDVINVGAVKFYPIEIENVILRLTTVDKVVVFGVPDDRMGEVIGAAILSKPGHVTERRDVSGLFRNQNCFLTPKYIWSEENFPMTSSGKVDRQTVKNKCIAELGSYRKFADLKITNILPK